MMATNLCSECGERPRIGQWTVYCEPCLGAYAARSRTINSIIDREFPGIPMRIRTALSKAIAVDKAYDVVGYMSDMTDDDFLALTNMGPKLLSDFRRVIAKKVVSVQDETQVLRDQIGELRARIAMLERERDELR